MQQAFTGDQLISSIILLIDSIYCLCYLLKILLFIILLALVLDLSPEGQLFIRREIIVNCY